MFYRLLCIPSFNLYLILEDCGNSNSGITQWTMYLFAASSHVCSQLANYLLYCKEKCPLHPIWFTWCMKIEDFMIFMLAKVIPVLFSSQEKVRVCRRSMTGFIPKDGGWTCGQRSLCFNSISHCCALAGPTSATTKSF